MATEERVLELSSWTPRDLKLGCGRRVGGEQDCGEKPATERFPWTAQRKRWPALALALELSLSGSVRVAVRGDSGARGREKLSLPCPSSGVCRRRVSGGGVPTSPGR